MILGNRRHSFQPHARAFIIAMAAVLAVASNSARAGSDGDVMRDLGMLGEWAVDCRLPAGPTNQHAVFAASEQGEVTSAVRAGAEAVLTIRDVRSIAKDRVRWKAALNGIAYDVLIEVAGNRYRGLESVGGDGKTHVSHGFMTDFGWSTPWFDRCPVPLPTSEITPSAFTQAWQDCRQGRDHDRAIKGCSELIRVQPAAFLAHGYRGSAHLAAKELDGAIADFTEAIRLDPQYVDALNGRAWALLTAGKAAEGLPDVQLAVKLQPDNAAVIDTRAHIYEALGRKADALADYRAVLALLPASHPKLQDTRDAIGRLSASP